MEKIVATLPIKPQAKTNLGMLISPSLVNFLGDALNGIKIISTNTINTYNNKEKELPIYLQSIKDSKFKFDSIFNDSEHTKEILNLIQSFADKDIIKLSHERIVRCDCGKVDLLESSIRKFSDGKIYKYDSNGNIICSSCHSHCHVSDEKVLIIEILPNKLDDIDIAPIYLKKEIKEFEKKFSNSKILISKNRNTGFYIFKNGKKFFIDIDFIWMNFANLLGDGHKILIASNHQLLKMFIMNYINSVTTKQKLTFIAHPYLENAKEYYEAFSKCQNENYRKLFLLYQLKWSRKTCNFSETAIDYISNISDTRRLNLYRSMLEISREILENYKEDINGESITKVLHESTNMQKNIILARTIAKRKD